jgi:hypothetical protein
MTRASRRGRIDRLSRDGCLPPPAHGLTGRLPTSNLCRPDARYRFYGFVGLDPRGTAAHHFDFENGPPPSRSRMVRPSIDHAGFTMRVSDDVRQPA